MNKTAIKNYSVWVRRRLMDDIKQRAYELGITEKEIKEPQITASDTWLIHGKTLNRTEILQRETLVGRIRQNGFSHVVEETAYTWFNRFIALRFMEVNEYLPTGVRVLSSIEPGRTEPDILREALNISLDIRSQAVHPVPLCNEVELVKHGCR